MNIALKAGAASALTLAGMAAHASIASLTSGSSDAILFAEVINAAGTAAVASYAGDTGISLSKLESGTYTGTVLATDPNFQAFYAADTAGDTVDFGILGGAYTGNATIPNFKTPGRATFLTTALNNDTSSLAQINPSGLVTFSVALGSTINAINSLLPTTTATSIEGSNPTTSGQFDYFSTQGIAYWGGAGVLNYNSSTTAATLFAVTAGSPIATTTIVSSTAEETAVLSNAGLSLVGLNGGTTSPPPVPLPAAVWLLGSGLLGLTGVARRRSKA